MQKKSLEKHPDVNVRINNISLKQVPTSELKMLVDSQMAIEDLMVSEIQLQSAASSKVYSLSVIMAIMMLALVFHARPQVVFALACVAQVTMYVVDRIALYGIGILGQQAYAKYDADISMLEKKYPIE